MPRAQRSARAIGGLGPLFPDTKLP